MAGIRREGPGHEIAKIAALTWDFPMITCDSVGCVSANSKVNTAKKRSNQDVLKHRRGCGEYIYLGAAMDKTSRNIYLLQVKYEIAIRTGITFQDFFVQIASQLWGTDFEARRPQGKLGDGKCDGYRVSKKQIFQAYGTRKMQAPALEAKIQEDFDGALKEFGGDMKMWTLVHNDSDGLPRTSHDLIIALRKKHPAMEIEVVGAPQLLSMADDIPEKKWPLLCPNLPSDRDLRRVQFKEIDEVVMAISTAAIDPDQVPLRIPSLEKLSYNNFSPFVAAALKQGEIVARTVGKYFEDTSRADVGNVVCEKFKLLYGEKKQEGSDPDSIYFSLAESVGGLGADRARSSAVMGLLAYLFHTCEIFEDVPQGADL